MRRRWLLIVGGVVLSLVALGGLLPAPLAGAQDVTVNVDAPATVAPGDDFITQVDISQVTNFDAGNFDVVFDPTVLDISSITNGNIGGTTIPVVVTNEISPGRVRVVLNVPLISGVSGLGHLCEVHFSAIGAEGTSSDIDLENGRLGDNTATAIPATWLGASVDVTSGPGVTLESVAVSPASASIQVGQTQQFTATATYSDASTDDVTAEATWESSNPAVATVAAGLASGVAEGSVAITATLAEITGSAALEVTAPVVLVSIAVTPESASMLVGGMQGFTATGTYSDESTLDITDQVTWTSSDKAVAALWPGDLFLGVSEGSVVITASLAGISGSATLDVTASVVLVSIAVTPASAMIAVEETQEFTATATYSDGDTDDVTDEAIWASSDEAVATVEAGVATGVGAGSATITATLDGISGEAALDVVLVTLESIAVTPESASIRVGRTQEFTATATYTDESGAYKPTADVTDEATWASSNEKVATVETGLASGVRGGTTTITATVKGVVGSATLRVRRLTPVPTPTPIPPDQQVIIGAPEGGAAEVIDPGWPTQVSTPDGDLVLDIPQGFVEESTQVVVAPVEPPEPPAGGRHVLRALSITAYDLRGNEITVVSGIPARLTVSYTEEDLQLAGGDPTRLLVMRYVPERGWFTLRTTVDTERQVLTVDLTTFSVFALGVETILAGDINADGVVNYLDLAILGASYGTSRGDPWYRPGADLNGDGSVGLLDLAILAANYGTGR